MLRDPVKELPHAWWRVPINQDVVIDVQRVRIRNFRSIGSEGAELDLTKPVSLVIGPNNAGKSNALRALRELFVRNRNWMNDSWDVLDRHHREGPAPTLELDGVLHWNSERKSHNRTNWLSTHFAIREESGDSLPAEDKFKVRAGERWALRAIGIGSEWLAHDWVRHKRGAETMTSALVAMPAMPVAVIDAVRAGMPCARDEEAFKNAAKELLLWNRPGKLAANNLRWQLFLRLFRGVFGHGFEIEPSGVTDEDRELIVIEGEARLPLSHYGTGFQEVLMLCKELAVEAPTLFVIEEPEVHLHPRSQRRLLSVLNEYCRDNGHRAIVSTHSPFLLSGTGGQCGIVRVTRDTADGGSVCTQVALPADALHALSQLGVSASDVLQTRFVVWVEGPSDAVFIEKWIELYCREQGSEPPIHGVDYCYAWYGGACVAHVTVAEGETPEERGGNRTESGVALVNLLHLCQYGIVVVDSDRDSEGAPLKQRVVALNDAISSSGDRYAIWVTDGREIENYLTEDAVCEAYSAAEGNRGWRIERHRLEITQWGRFNDAVRQAIDKPGTAPENPYRDKVEKARMIVSRMNSFEERLGLRNRIETLVAMIRLRAEEATP